MKFCLLLVCAFLAAMGLPVNGGEVLEIGSRLELMVDRYLIDSMSGGARLELHRPERNEIVMQTDEPWEGNASGYQSVFQDGSVYRMYYRGGHYTHGGKPAQTRDTHPWVLCYAESDDGIHWRKPNLGILDFEGSTQNNIVLTPALVASIQGCPAHTAVFKDANPDCPEDQRYKIMIVGNNPGHGLYVLVSPDGLHFSLEQKQPLPLAGAFDSQNLAFWDPVRGEYRAYWRIFTEGITNGETWKPAGFRAIRTATSKDLVQWSSHADLTYEDSAAEHLYTNQIQPYYRAPHILMGFPMRYNDRGWSGPMLDLPGQEERLARAKVSRRYGTAITDALFMSSRDGLHFHRWSEAFIRPGPRLKDTWVYGDNFVFWGMVETKSHLENAPNDISLYATEGYWEGAYTSVRRYTLRIDGFVSAYAPLTGGEIVTKPFIFEGGNLTLNAATSAAGGVQVEIQDATGKPIQGYCLDECPEIFCDSVRHVVRWRHGGDVRPLAGKPVRLRFVLRDADLFAFQFVPFLPDPERPNVTEPGVPTGNK